MFWNKKHFYHLMIRSSSYPSEFEEVVQNTGQDLARKGKYVFSTVSTFSVSVLKEEMICQIFVSVFPSPGVRFLHVWQVWRTKYYSGFLINCACDYIMTCCVLVHRFSNFPIWKSINIWLAPEDMNILSQLPFDVFQLVPSKPSNLNIC